MKVNEKVEALRKAGINVNNLFSLTNLKGEEVLIKNENGQLSVVEDDDPILKSINKNGTVRNNHLFRRWVMAQMFHMLATGDFNKALKNKGYGYEWKMVEEELRVQSILYKNDEEEFKMRNNFFNRDTVVEMTEWYKKQVNKTIDKTYNESTGYCRFGNRSVHIEDTLMHIEEVDMVLKLIKQTISPTHLYYAVSNLHKLIRKSWVGLDIPMSQAFISAYKGAGGYYTMKNLTLFHGCRIWTGDGYMSLDETMLFVNTKAVEYRQEGWRVFGILKEFIEGNNINIKEQIAEWQK